uniref:Uncharacterized protein n=1 Tax=Calidris pygmaea TaxID=425635 RepID=A0A8C3J9X6_9CHAR
LFWNLFKCHITLCLPKYSSKNDVGSAESKRRKTENNTSQQDQRVNSYRITNFRLPYPKAFSKPLLKLAELGAAVNQVKEAGPSAGAGSMSRFISCHFILSEIEPDPSFNPPCYKTALILITQWLSKTKTQLMGTEAQTLDKNDLSSPTSSLLWMSIWVTHRQ